MSGWRPCSYSIIRLPRSVLLHVVPGVHPETIPLQIIVAAAFALAIADGSIVVVSGTGPSRAAVRRIVGHAPWITFVPRLDVYSPVEVSCGGDDDDGQPGQRPR